VAHPRTSHRIARVAARPAVSTVPSPARQPRRAEQPARDPLTPWWRAAVVLRVLTFGFAIGTTAVYDSRYARPELGWALITGLGVWTAVTGWCYLRENSRWFWLTVADLVIGSAIMFGSRLVFTHDQLAGAAPIPLLTTVWVSGVIAAGAIRTGPVGGAVFGVVLALGNFLTHGYVDVDLSRDAVLLVVTGLVIGMASMTARRSAEQLAHALRAEAATAERERLARSIHDSVLQVLARVQRRGTELGGEAAELARLAGEQEVALRALVAAAPQESTPDGEVDLRGDLQIMATPRVTVAAPGTRVMLPAEVAAEVGAVVREMLSNVAKHAPEAHAWVLLEDLGDEIVVSVRDDGPGIPAGRLRGAAAEGRMGVAKSIQGRVTAFGGQAHLRTAPGEGTEWEFRVPRSRRRARGDT
jgi:signal transduction histidine kinase